MSKPNFIENKYIKNLIIQSQNGNGNAYNELYKLNYKKIYAIFLRLLGSEDIAQKYTSQLFVQAYNHLSAKPKQLSFSAWLFGLAVHYSIVKTKKILSETLQEQPTDITSSKLLSKLDKDILMLERKQRLSLVLHQILGYSMDEMADITGFSPEDVNTFLYSAYKNLLDFSQQCETDFSTIKDYYHKNVSHEKQQLFEKHLSVCSNCKTTLAAYKTILTKIDNLSGDIAPNDDIWEWINKELFRNAPSKKEENQQEQNYVGEVHQIHKATKEIHFPSNYRMRLFDKMLSIFATPFFKLGIIAVTVLIIFIGYKYYFGIFEGANNWLVEVVNGKAFINNKSAASKFLFTAGDQISTGEVGEVKIKISPGRVIVLNAHTIVSRSVLNKNFKLEIIKGRVDIFSKDDAPVFVFTSNGVNVYDFGSESVINKINENTLFVTDHTGYLEVEKGNESCLLNAGSECLSSNNHVGIPYRVEIAAGLKKIIYLFNKKIKSKSYINRLLDQLDNHDGITFWNLLQRLDKDERRVVFNKMIEYFPLPPNVANEDVLSLDKLALRHWLDVIEATDNDETL